LQSLRIASDVARLRGKRVEEILGRSIFDELET
jgi:hypothetical protein